jgi:DNA-binding IclR family transcriptional regulator
MRQGVARGESGVAGAQAIRRAMDVIRAVAQLQRSGASLGRVARATGLNSSTAFRILRSLTEERMLYYDEEERSYHLGVLAFELGLATQGKSHVQERFRPVVEQVAARTRLTTYLMARSDNDAVCLLCAQGSAFIRAMPMDVGQRLPLGIGAGSVAILSTLDDEEVEKMLASEETKLDLFPGGRAEASRIRERVTHVRRHGFSISSGSVARGLTGVGVPVLPRRGLLQLAVSVSAVADTIDFSEAKQIAGVIDAAIRDLAG